jgi:lipopolysaccharide cholinephosphotransferase
MECAMDKGNVIELTDDVLRKLQLNLLPMLIEVDRICRKYDIQYSLDGGTLLGAVRDGGFIPWDDDADVVMLREEYFKFREACSKDLDVQKFFLQDYTTDPEYRWGYAKMRLNDTDMVRVGQEHIKSRPGVCMDIFVVDNVPDQHVIRQIHYFACYVIRKLMYSAVGMKTEKNPFLRGWYSFWYHVIPRKTIFCWRDAIASKCNKKHTRLISHMTYPYPLKGCRYGLPAGCFSEMQDIRFEGYTFRAFKDYDTYLSSLYGDYMTPPPVGKRLGHMEASRLKLIEPNELFSEEELKKL